MDIPRAYPTNARSKEYQELLETIEDSGECPFCVFPKYHKGEVLPELSGKFWTTGSNHPSYPGSQAHILLLTKRHVVKIEELTNDEWAELKKLFGVITSHYLLEGATLVFRSGHQKHTGGTIGHLHCQVVSGDPEHEDYKETGIVTRIG